MPQQSWLEEVVFSTLLTSTLPILHAAPNAPFDGAIYNGPISISKIPHYANRLHAVQTTKPTNPVHRIIGFKVQEMQVHNDNGNGNSSSKQQRIRVSVPEDPHYESVEFYILGWGPSSLGTLKQSDGPTNEVNPYGMDQSHVAIVPRAVARHFQTYKAEFMDAETLRRSVFPPSLYPFMVGLDGLAEALRELLETARVDVAVYISPETEVRFTGWKVHFVEDLKGLEEVCGDGELAVPDREAGGGGEHYFKYE